MAKGYGIVSATSVVVGEIKCVQRHAIRAVEWGGKWPAKFGRLLRDIFTDRARALSPWTRRRRRSVPAYANNWRNLEALTGEAVVAAAEAKEANSERTDNELARDRVCRGDWRERSGTGWRDDPRDGGQH